MEIGNFIRLKFKNRFRSMSVVDVKDIGGAYLVLATINFVEGMIALLTKDYAIIKWRATNGGAGKKIIFDSMSVKGDNAFLLGNEYTQDSSDPAPFVEMVSLTTLKMVRKSVFEKKETPLKRRTAKDIYFETVLATSSCVYVIGRLFSDNKKFFLIRYLPDLTCPDISPIYTCDHEISYFRLREEEGDTTIVGWYLEKDEDLGGLYPVPRKKVEMSVEEVFIQDLAKQM